MKAISDYRPSSSKNDKKILSSEAEHTFLEKKNMPNLNVCIFKLQGIWDNGLEQKQKSI